MYGWGPAIEGIRSLRRLVKKVTALADVFPNASRVLLVKGPDFGQKLTDC